jgi:serine/threonine protein phosphatase PrpC
MPAAAVLRGRDHPRLGACEVAEIGEALAVGISAGAERGRAQTNEDVGAVVAAIKTAVLVVADGHFGHEASEATVDEVLASLGPEPGADISDLELVELFFEAGVAVQRATTIVGCPHPDSRTTLALAVIDNSMVRWAAIGDSYVIVVSAAEGRRLDSPRRAYLGDRFDFGDVAGAMSMGRVARSEADHVVLATDGLADTLARVGADPAQVVAAEREAVSAGGLTRQLLSLALRHGARDAITVAVASLPVLRPS